MENQKPISVIDDVPGDTTEKYVHEFERPATIESIRSRFYVGHEYDVQHRLYIERAGGGSPISLVDHLGKEFLAGDDDVYEFDVRESVEPQDKLHVDVTNQDAERSYHANVQVSVDYENGPLSAVAGFLGGVL